MHSTATFSKDRKYRYELSRTWDSSKGTVCFVMLNPSIAGETESDPTINRCISFAKSWGYGGIKVVNLFALVSTDPSNLYAAKDPIGPDNDKFLDNAFKECQIVVLGWGNIGDHQNRAQAFLKKYTSQQFHCIKKNGTGSPAHPLYLSGKLKPISYLVR